MAISLIRFDLGKVFGESLVSERNIREALQLQTSPRVFCGLMKLKRGCPVLKVLGKQMEYLLEFWNVPNLDARKKLGFVLATSNNIEQLPPEMLRKGRFDEIFFCDLPTEEIRRDIFKIHLSTHNERNLEYFNLERLAKLSSLFSGAEIEQTVKDGMFTAFYEQRDLSQEDLENAISDTYPLAKTMRESITKMREWASARARLASSENNESLEPTKNEKPVPRLKSERKHL